MNTNKPEARAKLNKTSESQSFVNFGVFHLSVLLLEVQKKSKLEKYMV